MIVMDEKKDFVVVWQRLANSGVQACEARNADDAIEKCGMGKENRFVKHTVIEGKIVKELGNIR